MRYSRRNACDFCLRRSADDELYHSMKKVIGSLNLCCQIVKKQFEMKRPQTLQDFVNVLSASHGVKPFTERTLLPFQCFYLNRLCHRLPDTHLKLHHAKSNFF